MDSNFAVGELITGAVYLIVAARLYRLGSSNGKTTERILASAFFFYGVSSLLYSMATMALFEPWFLPLSFAARIIYCPTAVLVALFTRRVFRKDASWAGWLVWGSSLLLAVGIGGSILFRGDWEGFSPGSPWFWLEWTGFTYPFAWAATEAFIRHGQARRRASIGLCDPLLCNRFLLWALFGAFQVVAYVTLFPNYTALEFNDGFTAFWDQVYSVFLLASIAAIWLAFAPPSFYKRWISGSTATADEQEA